METTFNLTCDAVIRRLERAIEDGTVTKAIADDIKALIDDHNQNEEARHRLKNSKHAISSTLKVILYTASGIAVTFFGAFIANMFNHI